MRLIWKYKDVNNNLNQTKLEVLYFLFSNSKHYGIDIKGNKMSVDEQNRK